MTKSERLAKENKLESVIYGTADIIKDCNDIPGLKYISTVYNELYNGKTVTVDFYKKYNEQATLHEWIEAPVYAIINPEN